MGSGTTNFWLRTIQGELLPLTSDSSMRAHGGWHRGYFDGKWYNIFPWSAVEVFVLRRTTFPLTKYESNKTSNDRKSCFWQIKICTASWKSKLLDRNMDDFFLSPLFKSHRLLEGGKLWKFVQPGTDKKPSKKHCRRRIVALCLSMRSRQFLCPGCFCV